MDDWSIAFYRRGSLIYGWTTEPVEAEGEEGYFVVVYDDEVGPQPGVAWRMRSCCQADAKVVAIHLFELGLDPTVDFLARFEVAAE